MLWFVFRSIHRRTRRNAAHFGVRRAIFSTAGPSNQFTRLLSMAQLTGDRRYHRAALRVMAWSQNMDSADGAWTNELDPKSWKGTTVFAAIAIANALDRHGALLDTSIRDQWGSRLRRSGDFIHKTFDFGYGNINYPIAATHGLFLLGTLLGEPEWQARARDLARRAVAYFTEPSGILYGEGTPLETISPLGCRPVDLGYNVEESLPSLFAYSRLADDAVVEKTVRASMRAHLVFLLPDGAWDNSWGTRNYKWTYWGSRTSDGAIAAYLAASSQQPEFRVGMESHLSLVEGCTHDGLLYGGPHLAARGVPACVHHTFTHAKALAEALHDGAQSPGGSTAIPPDAADGIRHYPEIATWLARRGPWRATVTANDWLYQTSLWHPTGGYLSMLYHLQTGPLLAGSLASYRRVEAANMQPPPDPEDYPLTPRIDLTTEGRTYSTLYDLAAKVQTRELAGGLRFDVEGELCASTGERSGQPVKLTYRMTPGATEISVSAPAGAKLVLPVIATSQEMVQRTGTDSIAIAKKQAMVRVQATGRIELRDDGLSRVFNLIPGFLAVPLTIPIKDSQPLTCTIRVG